MKSKVKLFLKCNTAHQTRQTTSGEWSVSYHMIYSSAFQFKYLSTYSTFPGLIVQLYHIFVFFVTYCMEVVHFFFHSFEGKVRRWACKYEEVWYGKGVDSVTLYHIMLGYCHLVSDGFPFLLWACGLVFGCIWVVIKEACQRLDWHAIKILYLQPF